MTGEETTDEELMRQAFQALLRGDTKTRDEICERLLKRHAAREQESIKLAQAAAPYFPKH